MRIVFLFLLTLASLLAGNYNLVVAEPILQDRISKEFPITHETLLLTFKVSNPKLNIDAKQQRLNLTGDLQILNIQDTNGKALSAIAKVSSRIAYSKGGNLYLRQIRVLDIKSRYIGTEMKSMLFQSIETLLNDYFKSRPVYSLTREKGMIGEAVKSVENVVIIEKGVKIIFNLG